MENKISFGGVYRITHLNKNGEILSVDEIKNIVPNEGLTYINNVVFGGLSASSLYIGLYSNNYTPVATDVMSSFLTSASEFVGYSEAARPQYVSSVSGVSVNNTANKAVFTANASGTVRGAFISTSSIKNGVVGILISASLFTNAKSLTAGDTLTVEYLFTGSST